MPPLFSCAAANDDQPDHGQVRALPGAPHRGQRLRVRADAGLACRAARDRAAYSGLRHAEAAGWHFLPRRHRQRLPGIIGPTPCGARDEFHLAATALNLSKLAKLVPMPDTPQCREADA